MNRRNHHKVKFGLPNLLSYFQSKTITWWVIQKEANWRGKKKTKQNLKPNQLKIALYHYKMKRFPAQSRLTSQQPLTGAEQVYFFPFAADIKWNSAGLWLALSIF